MAPIQGGGEVRARGARDSFFAGALRADAVMGLGAMLSLESRRFFRSYRAIGRGEGKVDSAAAARTNSRAPRPLFPHLHRRAAPPARFP